ncbi:MAG: T9SS type A sorting domain-containing protein [Ignavibacteriae bacterium]|nr:T9SS type A sorting domain-containing protein [Ignavibacteriota bacterium]
MKKISTILFVVMISSLSAQTENKRCSLSCRGLDQKSFYEKKADDILEDNTFLSSLGGAVDTVWQYVEDHPGKKDVLTNQFFAASDGSFYFASDRFGGFLTKINSSGAIEWTIDRNFQNDSSKYSTRFQDISELPNGDILVYGVESNDVPFFIGVFPNRFIISPDGIVKEEKNTRNLFMTGISNYYFSPIFTDKKIYFDISRRDTISFYIFDTSFSKIQRKTSIKNEYSKDQFSTIRGAVQYDSTSFILKNLGLFMNDTIRSIMLLRFSNEYELLNSVVIHTGNAADASVYNDGSYMVIYGDSLARIRTSKYDNTGNIVWSKQPVLLRNFAFAYFELTKSQKEGFYVTGEIYTNYANGTVNFVSEERLGFIAKIDNDGECEWYYTSARKGFRNLISSFAEASNGDVVFVTNSLGFVADLNTPMQITRLRPKTTGVTEHPSIPTDNISIYPNPTSTTVTISGIEGGSYVRIMNSLGMEVTNRQVTNGAAAIDVTGLVSGIYFASIRTITGITVKPFIVSH